MNGTSSSASFAGPRRSCSPRCARRGSGASGFYDVFAPYPVHGLDEAMGLRRSRLPFDHAGSAASAGSAPRLAFQVYTAVFDWPLDVGGKPANSTLAFVPDQLRADHPARRPRHGRAPSSGAAAWARRSEPRLAAPDITDDALVLVLGVDGSGEQETAMRELLSAAGARTIEETRRRFRHDDLRQDPPAFLSCCSPPSPLWATHRDPASPGYEFIPDMARWCPTRPCAQPGDPERPDAPAARRRAPSRAAGRCRSTTPPPRRTPCGPAVSCTTRSLRARRCSLAARRSTRPSAPSATACGGKGDGPLIRQVSQSAFLQERPPARHARRSDLPRHHAAARE